MHGLLFTCFGQSFGDHQLRHVDLILQEVRYGLLDIAEALSPVDSACYLLLCTLYVPVDEHLKEARLDDGRHKPTVIPSHRLRLGYFQAL